RGNSFMNTPASSLLRRNDYRDALVLGVLAIAVSAIPTSFGVPFSVGIVGALRILDGDVPYRDFWTMYAPGHFYLVALLFKVFGVHVWVDGVAKLALIAIDSALLFAVTRRLGLARPAACLVSAAFIGMHWAVGAAVCPYRPAVVGSRA